MCVRSTTCKRILSAVIFLAIVLCCPVQSAAADALGTVPWLLTATSDRDARYQQCSLGDAAADAVRRYLDADIAIVNGGDLIGNLPPGEVTEAEVLGCIRDERTLAVATVTGEQLRAILESALSHVVLNDARDYDAARSAHDAFPQISGFRVTYDPGARPGERISRLTYQDKQVQPEDSFRLAATEYMLSGGYELPPAGEYTVSGFSLVSVMEQYIRDGMDDYGIMKTRVNAMDVRSQRSYHRQTILMCAGLAAVLVVLLIPLVRKNEKIDDV